MYEDWRGLGWCFDDQTDGQLKEKKLGDHVVKCVFKKGGQHLGRDGRECRLSLAQAPWPWPVPGNTELGSAGTKAPRLYFPGSDASV